MNEGITSNETIMKLNHSVESYEQIIICDCNGEQSKAIVEKLMNAREKLSQIKKCLIVSDMEISSKITNALGNDFCMISREELEEILELYHTYEFSDRITLISDNHQYPSLFNYLSIGLLTEEEFLEALLH